MCFCFAFFSGESLVYGFDDLTGGLQLSHRLVLSSKDYPGILHESPSTIVYQVYVLDYLYSDNTVGFFKYFLKEMPCFWNIIRTKQFGFSIPYKNTTYLLNCLSTADFLAVATDQLMMTTSHPHT